MSKSVPNLKFVTELPSPDKRGSRGPRAHKTLVDELHRLDHGSVVAIEVESHKLAALYGSLKRYVRQGYLDGEVYVRQGALYFRRVVK